MRSRNRIMPAVTVATALCGVGAVQADQITQVLTDDNARDQMLYNGAALRGDTGITLYEQRGPYNPATPETYVPGTDRGRGLIAFDLPSLPAGASVTGASLTLYLSGNNRFQIVDVSIFQMLEDWAESPLTGGGAVPAGTEGATWTNASLASAWAAPGLAAGVDYVATALDVQEVPGVNGGVFITWDITEAYLDWVADPATNFGLFLAAEDPTPYGAGLTFVNTENLSAGGTWRPVLTVAYEVPEPASLALMGTAGLAVFTRRSRRCRVSE